VSIKPGREAYSNAKTERLDGEKLGRKGGSTVKKKGWRRLGQVGQRRYEKAGHQGVPLLFRNRNGGGLGTWGGMLE